MAKPSKVIKHKAEGLFLLVPRQTRTQYITDRYIKTDEADTWEYFDEHSRVSIAKIQADADRRLREFIRKALDA